MKLHSIRYDVRAFCACPGCDYSAEISVTDIRDRGLEDIELLPDAVEDSLVREHGWGDGGFCPTCESRYQAQCAVEREVA